MISALNPKHQRYEQRCVMHVPTDRCAATFMHLGFMENGAVIGQRGRHPMVLSEGNYERAMRVRNTIFAGMDRLPPGLRPPHIVVGKISDGTLVTVAAVEMVYNDAKLINSVCGSQFYEKLLARRREVEVLELAKKLYKEPIIVAGRS